MKVLRFPHVGASCVYLLPVRLCQERNYDGAASFFVEWSYTIACVVSNALSNANLFEKLL